jgi:ATP-dependent helicase/nuclease subunit B
LNPLLRGSLLHELYARLLRRCRAEGRRADVAKDAPWLRDEGLRRLKELAVEMPAPSEEVRELETNLLLEDLALFVEGEARLPPNRTPIGFEVAFGRAGETDGEPLAQTEPVVVDLGALQLRIVGRIDRIDQVGPSRFEIVDYKTGSFHPPAWSGTFAGGTRLQHALYGLAAMALLRQRLDPKATVAGAEYYFPCERGKQERKKIPAPSIPAVTEVLSDLREVIASGMFVHASKEEACRWCQHGLACGRGVHHRTQPKLADPKLAPFVKLTMHE